MKNLVLLAAIICSSSALAQTNLICTVPAAEKVMLGQYDPAAYAPAQTFTKPQITQGVWNNLSKDSMLSYLKVLASFRNRNTGSDTVSDTRGVGAARRWVFSKFGQFSSRVQNRLIPSYLQFDLNVCTSTQHRNIFAVLPGTDTSDKSVIIVEAHMDSRCENDECDTACLAEGMEDNGSGTVLVMELARVMSAYSYKQSVVFLVTIGEEQGLVGADAFAKWCKAKGVKIEATLNNDVVGGVICGKTSSPPGCPGENHIDSTHVRLFSYNTIFSMHKSLVRFIKLEYEEEVKPWIDVPTGLVIMNAEDRIGRGGDHIPFRQQSFPAMRFTSANEHGDGGGIGDTSYKDRQHSTRDVLGKDVNGDGQPDSFYVDLGYLKRNAMINANSMIMAAIGPPMPPDFTIVNDGNGLRVIVNEVQGAAGYRIGIRTSSNDFNVVHAISATNDFRTYDVQQDTFYFISVAAVDALGTESMFTIEKRVKAVQQPAAGIPERGHDAIELVHAAPNPADETTTLAVIVNKPVEHKQAWFTVADMTGRTVATLPVSLSMGSNEVLFGHGFRTKGLFSYTLYVDGVPLKSGRLLFR